MINVFNKLVITYNERFGKKKKPALVSPQGIINQQTCLKKPMRRINLGYVDKATSLTTEWTERS